MKSKNTYTAEAFPRGFQFLRHPQGKNPPVLSGLPLHPATDLKRAGDPPARMSLIRSTVPLTTRPLCSLLAGCLCMLVFFPGTAHAYLDPGTGSMLLSAVIGIAATLFFMLKTFYYKAAGLFYRLMGVAAPVEEDKGIVFYSEGKQYWNTFKPVLEALDASGTPAVYLTSDEADPGLSHPFAHVAARCIGAGNRGYAAMNMLEADICVMTTPGLDVLQIRRSPGVKHYTHLVHSPTDAAFYKLYSFDYFDSVMCSGAHQKESIRFLEALRGTKPKDLLETGCPYMDVLAGELEQRRDSAGMASTPREHPRILLAPTWGANGLLRRFGTDLLLPMAEAGFEVVIRPHPQSRLSEAELLAALAKALAPYPNVSWDAGTSPLDSMLASDVLVSDLSGIVFDYAFILERPVVTVAMEVDTRGMDAGDLPRPAWELEKLPELGASIAPEDIRNLPGVIAALPERERFSRYMRELRAASLYNFRSSGKIAAGQLVALRERVAAENAE